MVGLMAALGPVIVHDAQGDPGPRHGRRAPGHVRGGAGHLRAARRPLAPMAARQRPQRPGPGTVRTRRHPADRELPASAVRRPRAKHATSCRRPIPTAPSPRRRSTRRSRPLSPAAGRRRGNRHVRGRAEPGHTHDQRAAGDLTTPPRSGDAPGPIDRCQDYRGGARSDWRASTILTAPASDRRPRHSSSSRSLPRD
jgi:hypothetical protein